jgi:riboflavin synthase
MFTGIVTDVGRVAAVRKDGDTRFEIATAYDVDDVAVGASIACSGVCLTVVDKGYVDTGDGWFAVTVSAETMARTTLGGWKVGTRINLERSLRVGDELGGHIVTGHVDGTASVKSLQSEGDSVRCVLVVGDSLERHIAPKGSVALDGISLTVNEVAGTTFGVNLIPHTRQVTTFDTLAPGDRVNLEIDVLSRYVARLVEGS